MGTRRRLSPIVRWCLLLFFTGVFPLTVNSEDEQHDAREGDDVTMQCPFSPEPLAFTTYWMRVSANSHENVAIGNQTLETNYKVTYDPSRGRYDLLVKNVSYEKDNGRFECRILGGSPIRPLHSQWHNLVVLTLPRPPVLSPGPRAHAQEGNEIKLACSTSGGSPNPTIKWYRDESQYPLESDVQYGKSRSEPSTATLTITPAREDDGARYRCSVWNRAMPEGQQMDATLDLTVDYYPRVVVGPENPLKVEIGETATMECKVDAKPKVNSVRWTRDRKHIASSFTHTIQGVSVEDAGNYTCSADNGLGRTGEKEIKLDVLYPPSVSVDSKTYEAEEGGTVEIPCMVSANPAPVTIEWTMEEKQEFRVKGSTLLLRNLNADMAGTYVCKATNLIKSSNGKTSERTSSTSVAVLVRHKPGRAYITPEKPVAQEGTAVTLVCNAKPPGWPVPQYRWFRDVNDNESKPTVLATGNQYTIPSVHLGSEGVYRCQATNELGHGEFALATLEVHQPPRFQTKLTPHMTKRSGEKDFSMSCSALGKPQPTVKWFKGYTELKSDSELYDIETNIDAASNSVFNVQSTLRFNGKVRPNGRDLVPEDRGMYSCTFENEVKKVESTMHLRIEHVPILIKQNDKVAYDIMENAEISCSVLSYPKPDFQWYFGANTSPLRSGPDGHYEINTSTDNNDSYLSVLRIKHLRSQDYGDYSCRVKNSLGHIQPQIRLQPKGAPDSPTNLVTEEVGPTYVLLKWDSGFDGGLASKFFIHYKRVGSREPMAAGADADACAVHLTDSDDVMENDCGRANPCNVTRYLDQHNTYSFKVKAVNTKGQSNYSNDIVVTTKVDKIPPPEHVTYDQSSKTFAFTIGPTCLGLVAVIESGGSMGGWQVVETLPLRASGTTLSLQENILDLPVRSSLMSSRPHSSTSPLDDFEPDIRLKICLQTNQNVCSDYAYAENGPPYMKEASMPTGTMVAILISVVIFTLLITTVVTQCICLRIRRNKNKKKNAKDYEMESIRQVMVSPQNQAPPPYYPSAGMENKALEHSMDLADMNDDPKNAVYATQSGYGYIAPHAQTHPTQNIANSDWNMGYIENSYTNSNNGGSVNSQDSLWQMKMAGGNNPGNIPVGHQMLDRQSNYGYDPIAHGGYGTIDDYAPFPALPSQPPPADYGMRTSQNPSRQEYCSDPYASVHKPKKRIDQHIESPYHEVSGLPEAYGSNSAGVEEGVPDEKPPHLSLSYDESLESGYSTPNSRARRVIREIIV